MIHAPEKEVLKISEVLKLKGLTLPDYQRPYKWTVRNIHQLFQDIQQHSHKKAYRLGTLVFHRDDQIANELNIVDGQQRILTLLLTVHALIAHRRDRIQRKDLLEQLHALDSDIEDFMQGTRFSSEVSQRNLSQNFMEIRRLISHSDFTEQHIDFLLNRCEVVIFTLHDISEAFQFFDAQNARGRDLEPHDLLKAYHLREFGEHEQELKGETVAHWEALESNQLAALFAHYLYRIRRWAQGNSARYFGKNDVGAFKGVNIDRIAHFPYVESLRIAHHYVDEYNQQYHRKIDGRHMRFPFHLDQQIINGRRFFEMASHYQHQIHVTVNAESEKLCDFLGTRLTEQASRILNGINSYNNRHRTGDKYVRAMFDCALIFYIDKFHTAELSLAIEKIFIWAYQLRVKQQVVQLATMDKYVLEQNIFIRIKNSTLPADVLSIPLRTLTIEDNKNNSRMGNANKDALVKLFKEMNYYE